MNKVAVLPAEQRAELFSETAARKGIGPAIIEKDFWVCWALSRLFEAETLSSKLLFKGGTSLSKVFHLIERFSEDVDKQQRKFNEQLSRHGHQYIRDTLLPEIDAVLGDCCQVAASDDSPAVIDVQYPAAYSESYLRPEIRLEIGPRALWCPNATHTITPYAAEEFPDLFETPRCRVNVVTAERTFWEKATILHHEAHRPQDSIQPQRYSRHYYDMARLAESAIKNRALEKLDLLQSVVLFKDKFFPRGWARYDLAVPGSLRLVPPEFRVGELKKDYDAMQVMIYGQIPGFSEIMDVLSGLEQEINQLKQ
jgi:hypothetical protein